MNYIFSLLGTVLYYDPRTFLRTLWKDEARALRLYEIVFNSPEWRMLENGSIKREDAMEWLCRAAPAETEHIRLVLKHWLRCLTPRWETVELLLDMKEQGQPLYFTAQMGSDAKEYIQNTYPFMALFEGGVFSCDTEARPLCGEVCRLYRLDPSRSIWVSGPGDTKEDAQLAGLRGIAFSGAERLRDSFI